MKVCIFQYHAFKTMQYSHVIALKVKKEKKEIANSLSIKGCTDINIKKVLVCVQ